MYLRAHNLITVVIYYRIYTFNLPKLKKPFKQSVKII